MDKKELWQEVLQANEEFEQSKKKCKENPTRENMMEKRYCESKVVFAVVQFELACNGTIEGLDKKIKKSMFEIGRLVGLYESYISMEMYCKNKNARIVTFGPQEEDEE